MLFIGAGASKAFGIDQLRDLIAKVNVLFRDKGYSDLIHHICDNLSKANKDSKYFVDETEIDLEVTLSVLDLLVDPAEKAKDVGPSSIYAVELIAKSYTGKIPNRNEFDVASLM